MSDVEARALARGVNDGPTPSMLVGLEDVVELEEGYDQVVGDVHTPIMFG